MKSLYEKTIAFVLQYIDEQKLREGDQLPTEAQLSALAGVSLVTVRRALSELSSQAVVRREQGRGTFVARPRVKAETTKIGGLRNGLHLDARSKLQTRVLELHGACLHRRRGAAPGFVGRSHGLGSIAAAAAEQAAGDLGILGDTENPGSGSCRLLEGNG